AGVARLLQQSLDDLVAIGAQRVGDPDPQHQVHAASQVEAQLDLLLRRPGARPHHHGDEQDQQTAPEQALVHSLVPRSSTCVIADFDTFTFTWSAILRTTTAPSMPAISPWIPPLVTTLSPFCSLSIIA